MTNPHAGNEPYGAAWQHGKEWGEENPGSDQPTPPDFSGWGYDATTTGYIGQVWQEGVLAGRDGAQSSPRPTASTPPAAGHSGGEDAGHSGGADAGHSGGADAGASGPQVQYDQPPAPGPVAVVQSSGEVVEQGHAVELNRAGQVSEAPHLLEIAIEAALIGGGAMPGIGPLIMLVEIAHSLGCTVAVGLDGQLAAVVGADAGAGVYYTPAGHFGLYGSLAADLGAVLSASISEAITVVRGDENALAGNCLAVTGGGGEGIVGSGSVLFTPEGAFLGLAGSVGFGAGWPIAVYGQYQHTWIKPLH